MIKVRQIKTGDILERHPVDARELVEHELGEYEYVDVEDVTPKGSKGKQPTPGANPQGEKRERELEEMTAEQVRVLALEKGVAGRNKGENIANILKAEFPEG